MLWISVVAWGFWLGGLMYEMVVIMPLWSANLPNTVLEWNARPNFVLNPTRFYLPIVITLILSSLLAMVLNWKSSNQRLWLIGWKDRIESFVVQPEREVVFGVSVVTGVAVQKGTADPGFTIDDDLRSFCGPNDDVASAESAIIRLVSGELCRCR